MMIGREKRRMDALFAKTWSTEKRTLVKLRMRAPAQLNVVDGCDLLSTKTRTYFITVTVSTCRARAVSQNLFAIAPHRCCSIVNRFPDMDVQSQPHLHEREQRREGNSAM
ncbi:hypothetical protein VCUG_02558 [Vavraia culicis subsp. floridensis]|uniref:Uncharacterized protein n=1 Tax=Vavraia culicis (isolate floridensis) TaxID=948595 RepID=L2GS96_VAVCU|nr:uncharacterized protein VCUG_02558 [Vavraia culicis subsp. floridensis]ELA45950.1 hypothetical protein VCUG_02558 [Vavraia culicis subsp. floridensis]